jgi:hypothetical protein
MTTSIRFKPWRNMGQLNLICTVYCEEIEKALFRTATRSAAGVRLATQSPGCSNQP